MKDKLGKFFFQLYGEFADPFKLSECKLAIIHCAGHSDPILVQTLWQEVIEKGRSYASRSCDDLSHCLLLVLYSVPVGFDFFFPSWFLGSSLSLCKQH